jgi:hypothetical protein
MPSTLDLNEVRRFTDDIQQRIRQCDNGEGWQCSTLELTMEHYARLCTDLQTYIREWDRGIFEGEKAFDQAIEDHLKAELDRVLKRAKDVAARGRVMEGPCYALGDGLWKIHLKIVELDYLRDNWVTPRRATSPAPRIKLALETEQQIGENLKKLSG